jgi:flagellin-specific chaperone FliS
MSTTNIENIIISVKDNVDQGKYTNKFNIDFLQGLFDLVLDCMELIEKFYKQKTGQQKKELVIKVGKIIIQEFFPEKLNYYNENVSEVVENIINSYKILSKLKNTAKCFCFFC